MKIEFLKIFEGDYLFFLPEMYFFFFLLSILIFNIFFISKKYSLKFNIYINLYILIYIFLLYLNNIVYSFEIFFSLFISSFFIIFLKIFLIFILFLYFFLLLNYTKYENIKSFEFIMLINFAIFGMLLLLSCNDFLSFYVCLELQSLSLYILATYKIYSNYSTEAGLKYFVLGAVSTGILLFGVSFLYGFTGLTNFNDLKLFFLYTEYDLMGNLYNGFILVFILILVGFFFKLGVVPFHMWLPDVYEGVSTIITAFFSIFPKIAFIGIFSRFCYIILDSFFFNWSLLFIICGLSSVFIGTFGALYQIKLKRILAYSAISHMGYMLLSLSTFNLNGLTTLLIYLIIYSILNIGFFSILISLRKLTNLKKIKYIYELKAINKSNNFLAIIFAFLLFSIAGIPPLGGFFSKLMVFLVLIQNLNYFVIFILLILSVVSTFFYVRIIKIMFFDLNKNIIFLVKPSRQVSYVLIFSVYFNIFFICFANLFFIKINEIVLNFL